MTATNLIPTPELTMAEQLSLAYQALLVAIATAQADENAAKQARSNLCEAPEYLSAAPKGNGGQPQPEPAQLTEWEVTRRKAEQNRRRLLYCAAYLKTADSTKKLQLAIAEAQKAVAWQREEIEAMGEAASLTWGAVRKLNGMANCFLADDLLITAYRLHKELSRAWPASLLTDGNYFPRSINLGSGVNVDLFGLLQQSLADSRREWLVFESAGGHLQRQDIDSKIDPNAPLLTYAEAYEAGCDWISYADTVGGTATLYNVQTKEIKRL